MNDNEASADDSQEQGSAEDEAAFAAGFGNGSADLQQSKESTDGTREAAGTGNDSATDGAAPGATANEPAPAAAQPFQITREQWEANQQLIADQAAELAKFRDATTGQLGGLQRTLTQVQAGGEVSADDFAGLRALGLDDVADSLAKDLSGVFKKMPRVAGEAQAAPAVNTDEIARTVEFQLGVRGLRRMHPDFEAVRDSAEFREYMGTKPQDKQAEFAETLDPTVAGGYFTEFKQARARATAAATAASNTAASRRNRFAAAEAPRGTPAARAGGHEPSDEEAFAAGFKHG